MIILDTNVLSELMKGAAADAGVLRWSRLLLQRPATTSITRAEVLSGIAVMPAGQRRSERSRDAERLFVGLAEEAAFDAAAAQHYATVYGERTRSGRPVAQSDMMIAAICLAHEATLATRNTKDFEGLGLDLVDPWQG